jgi:hypothetical protein
MKRVTHYYCPGFEWRLSQATRLVGVLIVLIDMYLTELTNLLDLIHRFD